MDIFNRPPTIAEDALHYSLYPPDIADKAHATALAACILAYVESLLPGFLWHRDSFELKVVPDPHEHEKWILEGIMRVGDCVDDEWCVVWLLKEISAKWDVVIGVYDSDGDFLLIEAAEVLPPWVKPSNAENRVWISRSNLHLISISHVSAPSAYETRKRRVLPGARDDDAEHDAHEIDQQFLDIKDALALVRDANVDTKAPEQMEKVVWNRISRYPAAASDHVHVAKAHLPIDIAMASSKNPHLVQKAIETFYTRDASQLRASARMSRFPPEPSVLTTVKMTRTGYAQLVGQKFYPPKVFGKWNETEGSKEWRWRDTGMKIACGFEMLYQEDKKRTDPSVSTAQAIQSSIQALKEACRRDPDYKGYIQTLVSSGYFKGELEGSQQWNMLEDKAAATFADFRRKDDATRRSFAEQVTAAISQAEGIHMLPQGDESSDDWLNVDFQSFDEMLEKTLGDKNKPTADVLEVDISNAAETEEDKMAKLQAERLSDLAGKVQSFVDAEGGLSGAKFEDEPFSDEEFGDADMADSDDEDDEQLNTPENNDSRQAAMDRLVKGLEPSEYGQMPPSFHSNSQPVARSAQADGATSAQPSWTSAATQTRSIRPPILTRDKYEGVDSDDETDSEEERANEEDDERPQIVGEIEVDMEEEEEEFLEFSRQTLGINEEQWAGIVKDRRKRGAFVPASVTLPSKATAQPAAAPGPQTPAQTRRTSRTGARSNVNPNLDSFEAVMQAMDLELARAKKGVLTNSISQEKGKEKAAAMEADDDRDIEAVMDAELAAALERGDDDDDLGGNEGSMDYGLIKNFLESFKSQAGSSGPVSNLAGRLQPGWHFPRDAS